MRDVTRDVTYFINAVNMVDNDLVSPSTVNPGSLTPGIDDEDDDDLDPNERRRRRRRRQVRIIAATGLRHRLLSHCRTVTDNVIPAVIEALRASLKTSSAAAAAADVTNDCGKAQLILVESTIRSLQVSSGNSFLLSAAQNI